MFYGSIVPLVTPFDQTGAIDEEILSDLVEWHISEGTDAIVVCGTTGEASTLSDEEKRCVIKRAVLTARKRVPIIAGTGCNDTRSTVLKTRQAKECGADGCLVIVPYYNRPTPEGCYFHYLEVAKVGLPIIFYHNHPKRTGLKLSAEAIALIMSIPEVVGIKEGSCDVELCLDIMRQTSKPLLSGDDALTLPLMACGAAGGISTVANLIPRPWKRLTQSIVLGDLRVSKELFSKYAPLYKALFLETNPQGVKYALGLMGKCLSSVRLPLLEPREETRSKIAGVLRELGLIEVGAALGTGAFHSV